MYGMHYNDAACEQVRVCDVRQQNMPNNQQTFLSLLFLSFLSFPFFPTICRRRIHLESSV